MKKGGVTLIGMIVALVFILIGFFGPWYTLSIMGVDASYGLTSAEIAGVSYSYGEQESQMGDAKGIFDNTMYMTIIALIFAIIAIIGILGAAFNFGNPNTMGKIGGIFGILTFLLAIIAPLYFMTSGLLDSLESGMEIGFWNELGGPGYAWYLMIIAAIIALISSIPMFKKQAA